MGRRSVFEVPKGAWSGRRSRGKATSAAKAAKYDLDFVARLKPCPDDTADEVEG